MSNYLALATVTKALTAMLADAVAGVTGAGVSNNRPSAITGPALEVSNVNVYLYQVVTNPHLNNHDLPAYRAGGSMAARPQMALTLHYLLSFYGKQDELVPERLLGKVVSRLHGKPQLTRSDIIDAVNNSTWLTDSDLADQVESVKFTPLSLNLEEFSKLWSVFFQTTYVLSLAYSASVVLLASEGKLEISKPVQTPNILLQPPIQAVLPTALAGLQLWLRADAGITLDADGLVTRWEDQSGQQNDARQGDANAKPLYVRDAVNRKPVLRFDGIQDYLVLESLQLAAAEAVASLTLFAVVKSTSPQAQTLVSLDAHEYWSVTLNGANGGVGWHSHAGAAGGGGENSSFYTRHTYDDAQWHLICVRFAAGNHDENTEGKRIFVDGSPISNPTNLSIFENDTKIDPAIDAAGHALPVNAHGGAAIGSGATRIAYIGVGSKADAATSAAVAAAADEQAAWVAWANAIGPAEFFKGDFAEVVLYADALSTKERQQIEQYFIDKYTKR